MKSDEIEIKSERITLHIDVYKQRVFIINLFTLRHLHPIMWFKEFADVLYTIFVQNHHPALSYDNNSFAIFLLSIKGQVMINLFDKSRCKLFTFTFATAMERLCKLLDKDE